ncbi:hypothetical protein [Streptomyces sp. NK08204]|uniref:hypothetical protein n=1 Tax=Streptomyces sp. NK08204 TaxID=2873260 RepID=UPI001CECDE62|nr:hypothetical protein [Streptomyces sp. NK08204]
MSLSKHDRAAGRSPPGRLGGPGRRTRRPARAGDTLLLRLARGRAIEVPTS